MENAIRKVNLLESFKSELLSKIARKGDAIIRGNADDEARASQEVGRTLASASKVLSTAEYQELFSYKKDVLEPGQQRMIMESPIKEAEYRKALGQQLRKLNPRI